MKPNNSNLIKIDQLWSLVDNDQSNHKLKSIAQLFLDAATDWDTFNLTDISDFVRELKDYFGTPLTKELIETKAFNLQEAWKQEAGASIIEMLQLSEQFYNQTDFDEILGKIYAYYEFQLQK